MVDRIYKYKIAINHCVFILIIKNKNVHIIIITIITIIIIIIYNYYILLLLLLILLLLLLHFIVQPMLPHVFLLFPRPFLDDIPFINTYTRNRERNYIFGFY